MSENSIKVTDRRMFTPEGQLREDYRHLEDVAPHKEPEPDAPPPEVETPPAEPAAAAAAVAVAAAAAAAETREVPALRTAPGYPEGDGQRGPQFMDLISMLAEPASLYLRQAHAAKAGDLRAVSEASQNLELAHLHIDLMVVLREKSASNLADQELAMLDDVIFRLQQAFTQAQGD